MVQMVSPMLKWIALVLACLLAVVAGAADPDLADGWQMRFGATPGETLQAAWNATWTSHRHEGAPLPRPEGRQVLWMRTKLPQLTLQQPMLTIVSVEQGLEAFLDDTPIYSYGVEHGQAAFAGYRWHAIPLPANAGGRWLTFRIVSNHRLIGINGAIQIRTSAQVTHRVVRNSAGFVVVGSISAFLGLLGLAAFATRGRHAAHFFFGMNALAIGLYLLFRSEARVLLFPFPELATFIEFSLYFLASTAIPGYVASLFSLRRTHPLSLVWMALLAYSLGAIGLAAGGIVPLMATLLPFQIMMLSGAFFTVLMIAFKAIRRDTEAMFLALGVCCLLTAASLDVLVAMGHILPSLKGRLAFVQWGTLAQVIAFASVLVRRFLVLHAEVLESRQLLREKNERLEQLDKLKDQFLANTSHELRTPLNGIIGIAESLLNAGGMSDCIRSNLKLIVKSGRRLSSLINDILDFSKLKERTIELQLQALRPIDEVATVVASAAALVDRKKVEVRNEVPADLPAIEADENRFQQILYNLVGNAIKFTDRGSVTVSAAVEERVVTFHVSDTGIGIPEERRDEIFLPFEQGDASASRRFGGTGLGLTITRQLVELHGGRIWFETEVGRGTTFHFTIPASGREPQSSGNVRPACVDLSQEEAASRLDGEVASGVLGIDLASHLGRPPAVLIVDDEPVNRQVLLNHLWGRGFHLVEVSDGPSALREVHRSKPDLVLLDVMMPGMSGYEVCKRLRKLHSASELPIIFLTAKNQIENMVEGFAAGANDYLIKPFLASELLARVEVQLHNTLLTREVVESRRALEAVVEGVKGVLSAQSRLLALGRTVAAISLGMGASPCCFARVLLLDPSGHSLRDAYSFQLVPSETVPEAIHLHNGISLANVTSVPGFSLQLQKYLNQGTTPVLLPTGELLVPLRHREHLVGFVEICELGLEEIPERAMSFLALFSSIVSVVLQHAPTAGEDSACAA